MDNYMRRYFHCGIIVFFLVACTERSHSQVKVVYSYPIQNASNVSAKTTIGIRYSEAILKTSLTGSAFLVSGSLSGSHTGKAVLSFDSRTVIFTPDKIFSAGERVMVTVNSIHCKSGKITLVYTLTFQISKSKILPNSFLANNDKESNIEPFISNGAFSDAPPADFPPIQITKNNNPSPGHYYLSNFTYIQSIYGMYLMILDNNGNPLYQRSTFPLGAQDFRLQPNGSFTYFDLRAKKFYEMDSSFAVIDSFTAANGYETDYHELCMLPDGEFALLAMYNEKTDLRKVSGDSNAIVIYYALQQFDKDKNLIFEWRTEDSGHFAITDLTNPDFSLKTIDYVHCNSIDFDPRDTTFILSSRNIDEITKIDPEDGSMIWRLGGKHNQFIITGVLDSFSHQHDVRRLFNGNITLLDNGNLRNNPRFTRAVEYTLDEKNKILTKIWDYRHDPDVYADAMGSVQQLDNGNKLIGWGLCDSVAATEVSPDGTTEWEMRLPIGHYNYRMYKAANDPLASRTVSQTSAPTIRFEQNYPNPFSSSTTISFTTGSYTSVNLTVYDALGRVVRNLFDGTVEKGQYATKLDAGELPGGMYVCKLATPSAVQTKVIILSK